MSATEMASYAEDIAHVRAALAEGCCPNGHRLSDGGGTWGSCGACATLWTVTPGGYMHRGHGIPEGYWHVTEQGEDWVDQFTKQAGGAA